MAYIYSFLLGGAIVALSAFFSRNGRPDYAGMIMLFPAITIATLITIENDSALKVAKWGMFGLVNTAVFLGVFIAANSILEGQAGKYMSIIIAFTVWLTIFLILTNKYKILL